RPRDWLLVLIWRVIAQSFMMNFGGPRIMSQAIGIHPLYVVAAMLMGGQVAGFWGALFGIPVAGAMNLLGRPLMRRVRHQVPLYREIQGAQLPTRAFVTGPLRAEVAEAAPIPAEAARVETQVATPTVSEPQYEGAQAALLDADY